MLAAGALAALGDRENLETTLAALIELAYLPGLLGVEYFPWVYLVIWVPFFFLYMVKVSPTASILAWHSTHGSCFGIGRALEAPAGCVIQE